ncbi:hypothetical protein [Pantanalinema sp. GBBB05]|uniref:hypothetical protein n=1 Tax=Pantanalinema sp. GBBB05 TaxID=2604139 RepID=UPI001DB62236|nr:hypothetical protein [Pantanalinema sp. GBBB05]
MDEALISLLREQKAEAEQRAISFRRQANVYEALAESLEATIRHLEAARSQEEYQLTIDVSVEDKHPLELQANQETSHSLSGSFPTSIGDENTARRDRGLKPKDMRRSKTSRNKGYVVEAKKILSSFPSGLHINSLVDEIFETFNKDEFIRAKNSLFAELNRGVREGRLGRMKDSDVFFAEPELVSPLPPEHKETINTPE